MTKRDMKKFNNSLINSLKTGDIVKHKDKISNNLYTVSEALKFLGITPVELIMCIENGCMKFCADKKFEDILFDFIDLYNLRIDFILPKREIESRATIELKHSFTGDSFLNLWLNFPETLEHLEISGDELIWCMDKTELRYLADDDFNYLFYYLPDLNILFDYIIPYKRERESRSTVAIENTCSGDSYLNFWYTCDEAVEYLNISLEMFINYVIKSDIEHLLVENWMFLLFYREDLDMIRSLYLQ